MEERLFLEHFVTDITLKSADELNGRSTYDIFSPNSSYRYSDRSRTFQPIYESGTTKESQLR